MEPYDINIKNKSVTDSSIKNRIHYLLGDIIDLKIIDLKISRSRRNPMIFFIEYFPYVPPNSVKLMCIITNSNMNILTKAL